MADSFIVTSPATGPATPERDWVLRPDGALELLDNRFTEESSFFARAFSPDGDALVTAPGGVYAVDAGGNATRISPGTLIATGERHWAIEECDETLRCAYSIVEWATGTVTPGSLDPVARFGFVDPATHISPDGRSIAYRADTDGSGRRRILDVASGTSIEAGRINQVVYPDAWATDSSGLFFTDRFLQFVDRATATVTVIDDLDSVRAVATESFSQS
jgi:Tol biopolymer transport system component